MAASGSSAVWELLRSLFHSDTPALPTCTYVLLRIDLFISGRPMTLLKWNGTVTSQARSRQKFRSSSPQPNAQLRVQVLRGLLFRVMCIHTNFHAHWLIINDPLVFAFLSHDT